MRAGVRLAIDVGSVRIGVARCDSEGLLASPLTTVPRGRGDLDAIAGLAADDDVIEIIVGLPVGLSGREGRAAAAPGRSPRAGRRVAPVPVRLVDERFTTVIAHDALRQSGSDARAAALEWTRRRPRCCCRERWTRSAPRASLRGNWLAQCREVLGDWRQAGGLDGSGQAPRRPGRHSRPPQGHGEPDPVRRARPYAQPDPYAPPAPAAEPDPYAQPDPYGPPGSSAPTDPVLPAAGPQRLLPGHRLLPAGTDRLLPG